MEAVRVHTEQNWHELVMVEAHTLHYSILPTCIYLQFPIKKKKIVIQTYNPIQRWSPHQ